MNHSFNTDIAADVGVIPAVLLENIAHWIRRNEANKENFFDGDYWTFSSVSAWEDLFPYMTKDQIRRGLEKLEKQGFIRTGNYNKSSYDRTKWYALMPKAWGFYGKSNCQDSKIHSANKPNGKGENAEPIPDINKDTNTPLNPPTGEIAEACGSTSSEKPEEPPFVVNKPKPETSGRAKEASERLNGERKVPPDASAAEVLNHLNDRANRQYRPVRANVRLIRARLEEGYTVEDMKRVIDSKCAQWGRDEKMREYLRPATLFGAEKFAQYSGEIHVPAYCRPLRRPL